MGSEQSIVWRVATLVASTLFAAETTLAQSAGPTQAEQVRAAAIRLNNAANASYGTETLRTGALAATSADQPTVRDCEAAKKVSQKRDSSKSTAAERHAAAVAFRQCVLDRKAKIAVENAADVAILGSSQVTGADPVDRVMAAQLDEAEKTETARAAEATFMGMTFGVGVGFSAGKARITEASLAADGTIRATKRVKQEPRVILEAHYYGVCEKVADVCKDGTFGVGPFFGLAATNDTIEAFALGVMFGKKDSTAGSSGGFSMGIGAVLDKEVTRLARGFEEGKLPPAGETTVALEKRSRWSPILFFTKTF